VGLARAMDSRLIIGLLVLALPAVLIAVTIWKFASNPLSLLVLLAVMILGSVYLLSYTESF
jgi:hypothetical protein